LAIKSSKRLYIRKWNILNSAISVLGIVLLFQLVFAVSDSVYEWLYFRFCFQFWRIIHDYTIGFLPVPGLFLAVILLIAIGLRFRLKGRWGLLKTCVALLIWLINVFYILWGFNYNQRPLRDKYKLHTSPVDSNYIIRTFEEQTFKLSQLSEQLDSRDIPGSMEAELRKAQEAEFRNWDIPVAGRVRIRKLWGGSLLHFRTSGIYIPHAGEGHIDGGLYKVQHPFTMAHEMAHGYGITDESECNFIAYITCLQSRHPLYRYSAELAYWRYLASYYRRLRPEEWKTVYADLPEGLTGDLEAIRAHIAQYKEWMPKYRDVIYDRYLKSHGVAEGIRSYDQMIVLIKAYNELKNGDTPTHLPHQ